MLVLKKEQMKLNIKNDYMKIIGGILTILTLCYSLNFGCTEKPNKYILGSWTMCKISCKTSGETNFTTCPTVSFSSGNIGKISSSGQNICSFNYREVDNSIIFFFDSQKDRSEFFFKDTVFNYELNGLRDTLNLYSSNKNCRFILTKSR